MTTSFDCGTAKEFLLMDIESAHLTKNHNPLGLGKMDPFVKLLVDEEKVTQSSTQWNADKEPVWYHECPRIPITNEDMTLTFKVYNDSSIPLNRKVIGTTSITIRELVERIKKCKAGSLGLINSRTRIQLELDDHVGTLLIFVQIRDVMESVRSFRAEGTVTKVDPSWFSSPAERLGVSGGTAPFFKLFLTDTGMANVQKIREQRKTSSTLPLNKSYFIGKDLSRAADERDFYEEILQLQAAQHKSTVKEDVIMLAPFMFDYLGVLETTTTESETDRYQLLVMQNLMNDYQAFRMLDLKMGQQTAQGGWQGKSRFRAFKQSLLDGMTNSVTEGYRLEGFDGAPARITSMNPLMDVLAREAKISLTSEEGEQIAVEQQSPSKKTLWGTEVDEKYTKKARRMMLQSFTGAEIFRYLIDVHNETLPDDHKLQTNFMPIEMSEIALHELVVQLIDLAVTCHMMEVPQKWIGSSVALGFDAGLFPMRSVDAQASIRSKVICKVFDWGRSELLTKHRYLGMTSVDQADRQRFWNNYKVGMDRLAFNAARIYYHYFTNATKWTEVTLSVFDFDSLSHDDYLGKVTIPLPEPLSDDARALEDIKVYQLKTNRLMGGVSEVHCSITWIELPADSRLKGMWRVHIQKATGLPAADHGISSDPYCIVESKKETDGHVRTFYQSTCVKARNLNPEWNEDIDMPVAKESRLIGVALEESKGITFDESDKGGAKMAKLFKFREQQNDPIADFTKLLEKAAEEKLKHLQ